MQTIFAEKQRDDGKLIAMEDITLKAAKEKLEKVIKAYVELKMSIAVTRHKRKQEIFELELALEEFAMEVTLADCVNKSQYRLKISNFYTSVERVECARHFDCPFARPVRPICRFETQSLKYCTVIFVSNKLVRAKDLRPFSFSGPSKFGIYTNLRSSSEALRD